MALNFFLKRSGTASKRPDAVNMSYGEIDLNYDSTTGGLFYKNSAGSVVKVGPAQVGTAAPNATPAGSAGNSVGEFWYDTSTTSLKIWNGTSWVVTVNTGGFLPLTGGTMTGDLTFDPSESYPNLGVRFQDTSKIQAISNSTSTTSSTTAASATAVKTAWDLANAALPLSGGTMSGDIVLFSQIPSASANPASKYYADQIASGYRWQTGVSAATTAAFTGTVTYNNGAAGVGATLTLNTPITTIDGVTITTVGTRILVKNQVSQLQNGIYTYTSGGATTVLTRATDSDTTAELLSGNAYFVSGGTVNGNQTYVQIPTIATVGVSSITYSLSSVKPFHKYSLEWNVDPVAGDDTTGTGGEQQPYKTIAKALISAGNTGSRVILHQGTYTENLVIPNLNLEIVGANRSGATINGTVSFTAASSSVRAYGIQFLGNITHSGAGSVYIQAGTLNAGVSITKSGNGYLELDDMAADSATVSATGTGYLNFFNSRIGGITVNNAAAFVTLQDMSLVGPCTVTAGIFQINNASVFAATESGNGITAASGTTVTLRNVNFYTPSGVVARVSLAGSYSFNDVVVDRANSTLGTNLGSIARFDALDTFGPIYANGSAGTSGQILTSAGAGAPPTWNNAAGVPNASPTVFGLVKGSTDANTSAIGCNAAGSITTAIFGTAIGVGAGGANTTANYMTAVGACALCSLTTGSSNTALGALAGKNITTGIQNLVLGANVNVPVASGDCQLAIGTNEGACWLTGCSNLNIQPGAGILDCAGSAGTAGYALTSTGSNKVVWSSVAPSCATPLVRGIVFGCTQASNSALGQCALKSVTSGLSNTAVGYNALSSLTTTTGSTAIGDSAAQNATGCQNVAVGAGAMFNNANGTLNTAVGHYSMLFSSGFCNTALGQNSLRIVSGSNNVGLGINAGNLLTSGNSNVIIGPNVQAASDTNSCQLAIGFSATDNWLIGYSTKAIKPGGGIADCGGSCGTAGMVLMSTGSNGICWGTASGGSAATPTVAGTVKGLTGAVNTALGCNALVSDTSGYGNVALGVSALCSNVSAPYTTAVGACALCASTGSTNTALGALSGKNITTGYLNVIVGANVNAPSATGNCQLAIGWDATCYWITGDSNKNLCVYNGLVFKAPSAPSPTPSYATADTLFLSDSTYGATLNMGNTFGNGKQYIQFRNTSNAFIGNIQQTSSTTIAYVTSSDYRLKENVKDIEGATEVLRALPVHEFNFISDPEVVHQGFLAHELQEFVPLAVTGTKDEVDEEGNPKYQGVDASKVVPLLVAALKESIARIDALEAEVKELKSNS